MERTRRSTWIIPALAIFPFALAPAAHAEVAATTTLGTAAEEAPADGEPVDETSDDETKLAQATTESSATGDAAAPAAEGEGTTSPEATVSEEAKKPAAKKKDDKKAEEANLNPALQPGGIVASDKAFPLHITASLTQSVGSGTFAPGYSAVPSLPTNLTLRPAYNVPDLFDWQPRMVLTAAMSLDIEWASSSQGSPGASTADRQIRVSDPSVGILFPGLVKLGFMNTTITPSVRMVAPLSVASRFNNRLAGFAGGGQAMYMQPLGAFGTLIGIYAPSATGWTFTDDAGNCKVRGRQIVGSLVNTLAGVYSISDPTGGNHNVSLSAGTWHAFMRPLADRPELRGEYAAPQSFLNFAEWTFGDISYSYSLPIETSVTLTAGVSSLQPMWTNTADGLTGQVLPRLPWFDLNILNGRSSNNFTSGYLNLTVAL